jgi:ABC-type uncharacterized transport system substrate-binding protein
MKRRDFTLVLGGAATLAALWPLRAPAQQQAGPAVVGILSPISSGTASFYIEVFRAGLRDLGYLEGRDIKVELRFANGVTERLPDLAAELVALKPAVIIAGGPQAALAVRNLTRSIPIVMNSSESPITLGFAESLARPGGNVTGFWWGDEGLIGRQLELLKEVMPGIRRLGIMVDPTDRNSTEPLKSLPVVTQTLGLAARVIELHEPADFEAAFSNAVRENLEGLHIGITPLFIKNRAQLTALAAKVQIPVIYSMREFVEGGGLMSYGMSLPGLYRDKARLVTKILTGTSPADLPIERRTKLELVINLKTAKALGISMPQTLQVAADEVIE